MPYIVACMLTIAQVRNRVSNIREGAMSEAIEAKKKIVVIQDSASTAQKQFDNLVRVAESGSADTASLLESTQSRMDELQQTS
jgi:hypothetical protein